jgi:RNA polymerase sigma-70 factor (ECF subfamily)
MTGMTPDNADHVDDLWRRVQAGDQDASEEVFRQYVGRLVAFARARLSAKLARRVDPEDVVQSVYRSFFVHARQGQYTLGRNGDLWPLLAAITLHKLNRQVEFHSAGKRAVDREESVSSADSLLGLRAEQLAREPTPADAMAAVEELDRVMQSLTPLHRQMLQLHLQGHTVPEVAAEVHRSERAVRRLLAQVREDLERRAAHLASG